MNKTKAVISKWVSIIQIILVFIVVLSCKKKNTVPTIETLSVSKITSQSAVVDIKLNNPSNFTVTQMGVLWYITSGVNPIPNPPYNSTSETINTNQFKSTAINLQPNTTYYFKSYFYDHTGIHYGNEISVTTPPSETTQFNSSKTYGSVTDIDGNTYKTIEISNQTWMAENLKVSKFNDGTVISEIQLPYIFNNLGESHWCYYDDNPVNENPYGKLYNSIVVSNTKNICPTGWRVPTNQDILELNSSISPYNNVGVLKSTGYNFWNSPNPCATNETGFSAIGSGERGIIYEGYKTEFIFWTKENSCASVSTGIEPYPSIWIVQGGSPSSLQDKGYSIRCIKD
jgi:uncharacterized protein (TIGR02145 family)